MFNLFFWPIEEFNLYSSADEGEPDFILDAYPELPKSGHLYFLLLWLWGTKLFPETKFIIK